MEQCVKLFVFRVVLVRTFHTFGLNTQMWENTDHKNSEYRDFSRNENQHGKTLMKVNGRRASFDLFLKFDKPFRTEYEHSKNVLQPLCASYHRLK